MLEQLREAFSTIIRQRSGKTCQYVHITYLAGLLPDRRDGLKKTPPVLFLVEHQCVQRGFQPTGSCTKIMHLFRRGSLRDLPERLAQLTKTPVQFVLI